MAAKFCTYLLLTAALCSGAILCELDLSPETPALPIQVGLDHQYSPGVEYSSLEEFRIALETNFRRGEWDDVVQCFSYSLSHQLKSVTSLEHLRRQAGRYALTLVTHSKDEKNYFSLQDEAGETIARLDVSVHNGLYTVESLTRP